MTNRCRRLIFAAIVLFAVTSWDAGAQAPPTGQVPATQRPSATGTIRGRITAAENGKPLLRVRILLTSAAPADPLGRGQAPISASTNTQGQFELTDVPPGLYRVAASRPGYLTIEYGQHRVREAGQSVEVKSGQTLTGIDIALPKAGVFAGQVTDELGAPYPGVRVVAMDLRYFLGSTHRVAFPSGFALTDDRGQFRMSDLMPGSYYVVASSTERWMGPDKQTFAYAPTYFPGVAADLGQALTLTVAQQRMDLDFSLLPSRTVRVAGRVEDANGATLAAETVSLAQEYRDAGLTSAQPTGSVRTGRDGAFEIADVPSRGSYRLSVTRRSANGQAESATLHVTIADRSVEGLVLVPRGGSNVNGTVVTEEGMAPLFPTTRLTVLLTPGEDDKEVSSTRSYAVIGDGSFRMTAVRGPWIFRLGGLPDGWMVKQVRLDDTDITELPFDVPTGGKEIGGFQIVITQKLGRVSGDVVDATGKAIADAAVVIFPDDAKLWVPASRFVRALRPDGAGHFALSALPPGKYHAAVKDFVEDGQENDPTFLESLRRDALTFELSEGGSQIVSLKLQQPK